MPVASEKRIVAPKRLLYGPGPSEVDPRAYEAMTQPVTGIRDPFFLELISEIQSGLRQVFGTKNPKTFPLPASGSGAMEAAIANFVQPGLKFAVFANGHFSNRIAAMGERQRATVAKLDTKWGEVFTKDEAREFIDRERPQVVAFVQGETSTGTYQSGKPIAEAARDAGALVMADCVTTLGAMPVELDSLGVDVAFSCSQKGLSCPAGMSAITVSPRAWKILEERAEEPFTWYLDLRLLAKYYEPPHVYHHTPSPPLYYALHQGLAVIEEEGLANRWERHRRAHNRLIAGLERLGFEPLVKNPADRLWHVTTVTPPAGVDEARLRQRLLDEHDIEIAGGLGELTGKILRIGTMGPLATDENIDLFLAALERCL
ncbi:MAG TPA: alanine--glyoxylate aminotransferase family protein [Bryobacteraceae bacterium]|nr:alanine--glyoxylate aminotransferase family protein [Bryobacteraceae bacterium]